MKFVKTLLASFVLLAVSTIFASNASAQTSTQYYNWTYGTTPPTDFVIATGTKADLNVNGNWANSTTTAPTCTGSTKICTAKVETFSGSAPSKSTVIQAVQNAYDDSTPGAHFFTNGGVIDVLDGGGNLLYRITIIEKS